MSDSKSLDEIKALLDQFGQFLSEDKVNLITNVINEIEEANDNSEVDQEKIKQLIDQIDIDPSKL